MLHTSSSLSSLKRILIRRSRSGVLPTLTAAVTHSCARNSPATPSNPSNHCNRTHIRSFNTQHSLSSSDSSNPSTSTSASSITTSTTDTDLSSAFAAFFEDPDADAEGQLGLGSTGHSNVDLSSASSLGEVLGMNMGIVTIDGLRSAHVGACVEFIDPEEPTSSTVGLILSIHSTSCRALVLGSGTESLAVGSKVRHIHGQMPILNTSKLDEYRGQVIDPLGRILDPASLEPIVTSRPSMTADDTHVPVLTYPPPPLAARSTSHHFLPTGFLHIDAFHPIADGLRIGVMGTKKTGKTALAAAMLGALAKSTPKAAAAPSSSTEDDGSSPQSALPSTFVYVCVGQSKAETRSLIDRLRRNGSFESTIVVAAPHESGMGLQYIAPFFGQTISDCLRARGDNSLIVFDDLSSHGQILTTINRVLCHQVLAPNFVHARLLERTAPLLDGASNTAIVLVETGRPDRPMEVNENLSGFVDHAIWLDPNLTVKGIFPPINVSSVLGRPSARYRPHIFRRLSNALSTLLLQSERRSNMSKWANEFGLEVEEDDRPLMEYKDKVQILLSQQRDQPALSLSQQFILLRSLERDEGERMAKVSTQNMRMFQQELGRLLHDRTITEYVELMDELEDILEARLENEGNSTQGKAIDEEIALKPNTSQDNAKTDEADTVSDDSNETLTRMNDLLNRVDTLLDRFEVDFVAKYEV